MQNSVRPSQQETIKLDQSSESATTLLYRAAIGPINTDYYQPIFSRFEAANRRGLSWNTAACLYTLNWMIFRKMWGAALMYGALAVVLPLTVLGLGRLLFQWSESTEFGLLMACLALGFIVPGLLGNAMLHAKCRHNMAQALATTATLEEACAVLRQKASSRQWFIRILVLNFVLASLALVIYQIVQAKVTTKPTQTSPQPETTVIHTSPPIVAQVPQPVASLPAVVSSTPAMPVVQAASAAQKTSSPVEIQAQPEVATSKPASAPTEAVTIAPKPVTKNSTQSKAEIYINVGLFANEINAQKAHRKLLEAGLPALTQEISANQGKRTRVRVGPFAKLTQAKAAAQKIRDLELDAVIAKK
jgi:cell division septation protein DedD